MYIYIFIQMQVESLRFICDITIYACIYICIYIYTHVQVESLRFICDMNVYACIYIYKHMCRSKVSDSYSIWLYTHAFIYVYIHTCRSKVSDSYVIYFKKNLKKCDITIYACIHIYIYVHTCAGRKSQIQTWYDYICMHIYIYIYIYTRMQVESLIFICDKIYTHVYIYICIHTCKSKVSDSYVIWLYTHPYIYIYIYTHAGRKSQINMWYDIYACTYIYIYTHTQVESLRFICYMTLYACIYIYIYIYTHTCRSKVSDSYVIWLYTHAYICIHIYTHAGRKSQMRKRRPPQTRCDQRETARDLTNYLLPNTTPPRTRTTHTSISPAHCPRITLFYLHPRTAHRVEILKSQHYIHVT